MRVLVTGATGFIGRNLVARLINPVVLSRDAARARAALGEVAAHPWHPEAGTPPAEAFRGVEAVVHLVGDPIDRGRWNDDKRRRIRDSRVLGTRHLVTALEGLKARPRVLVAGSAVGFYGSRGDEILDETAPPGHDFMADHCVEWEKEANRARELGIRVVNLRTAPAYGRGGGVLAKMLLPFSLGLGGRLGTGRQYMAWIHLDDLLGLILHVLDREDVAGPLNACAHHPVTNAEFTRALAAAVHRPAFFPVPEFALRLAFGGVAEVMLASQRVVPAAALKSGYSFRHPEIWEALKAAVSGQ